LLAFAARYHFARAAEERGVFSAVRGVEHRLRSEHPRWAQEVAGRQRQDACAGAELAARRGLDADLGALVLDLLERTQRACPKLAAADGLRSEALARSGRRDEAKLAAQSALRVNPRDAFALYTNALLGWRAAEPSALDHAQRSVDAGRGRSAQILKGLIAYGKNRLEVAETAFQSALREDANDVEAIYDLALVRQQQNRYLEAREGYLKVLSVRPKHADARFNLGVLAHSIGAREEAQHHLAKLREVAPNSPLVAKLAAILAQPTESQHASESSTHYSLKLGATPPSPAARTTP
jgi:tetratricopeptide (TPR) repeat protein